jgi:hypothetical protein
MTKLRASVTFQIFYAGCEARNRRRLKRINANKFHRKSGGVGHRGAEAILPHYRGVLIASELTFILVSLLTCALGMTTYTRILAKFGRTFLAQQGAVLPGDTP